MIYSCTEKNCFFPGEFAMLLRCSIENWMSFRDHTSFSMIATRERQHKDRTAFVSKYKMGVLPLAAIYGGNASGKTNFFRALNFAKNFIVKSTLPDSLIPVDTFRLDTVKALQPTSFSFEILVEEMVYDYSFAVTKTNVMREKLVRISPSSEKILFDRYQGKPHFDKSVASDQALLFAFRGTRDNQLFLSNAVSQKIDLFDQYTIGLSIR